MNLFSLKLSRSDMSYLMGNKRVILLGGLARSGKNTTGDLLFAKLKAAGKKVEMVSFADELKSLCEAAFNPIIRDLEVTYGIKIEGDFREKKSKFHRSILKQVGTDLVRRANPGFWVEELLKRVLKSDNEYFIVTDFRFPNEYYTLVRSFEIADIITINVLREGTEKDGHISENALNEFKFDCIIKNDGTLEQLSGKVDEIIATQEILA